MMDSGVDGEETNYSVRKGRTISVSFLGDLIVPLTEFNKFFLCLVGEYGG